MTCHTVAGGSAAASLMYGLCISSLACRLLLCAFRLCISFLPLWCRRTGRRGPFYVASSVLSTVFPLFVSLHLRLSPLLGLTVYLSFSGTGSVPFGIFGLTRAVVIIAIPHGRASVLVNIELTPRCVVAVGPVTFGRPGISICTADVSRLSIVSSAGRALIVSIGGNTFIATGFTRSSFRAS